MALLCTFPLFDSKLLPMAYSLTFNLLALLCTPPLGGKTSCCLLPVFCLLFRFVLQGLIIKTKFFGHFSCGRWVNETSSFFPGKWVECEDPPPRPEWHRQHSLISLTFHLLLLVSGPCKQNQMPAVCLLFSVGPTGNQLVVLLPGSDPDTGPLAGCEGVLILSGGRAISLGAGLWGVLKGKPHLWDQFLVRRRMVYGCLCLFLFLRPRCVLSRG